MFAGWTEDPKVTRERMEYHRTLDPKDERFDNLVAPLEFDALSIGKFIAENACAVCLGNLTQVYLDRNVCRACCITCEIDIMQHNYISKSDAEMMQKVAGVAKLELFAEKIDRDGVKRKPEEILEELGY